MNTLTPFAGSQQSTDLAETLKKFKKTSARSNDGAIYIKMAKDGEWTFGSANEVAEKEDKWAVNPFSVQSGYIAWSKDENYKGSPLGEEMYAEPDDKPLLSAMPFIEDGRWVDQSQVSMQCRSGGNAGLDVVFKTSSMGGIRAINDLVDAVLVQSDENPALVVPVVELGFETYMHKKYGKLYNPVLEIVAWIALGDGSPAEKLTDDSPSEETGAVPIRRRRK